MEQVEKTAYIFKSAMDFSDLLTDNEAVLEKIKEKVPAIVNFSVLKKSLSRKPCSCGGVDVEDVMKKRSELFNSFYTKLFLNMKEEILPFIKEAILSDQPSYDSVIIMNGEEEIRKF